MAEVNLIQLIRDNPGAVAIIDNDWWGLYKEPPDNNPHYDDAYEAYDEWEAQNELASCRDTFVPTLGNGGYGSGNCYGGDLLQAMAAILQIHVESV